MYEHVMHGRVIVLILAVCSNIDIIIPNQDQTFGIEHFYSGLEKRV